LQRITPANVPANSTSTFWTEGKNLNNLKDFFAAAQDYIDRRKQVTGKSPTTAIQPGSTEWNAWETYFLSRFGALPVTWVMVTRGQSPSFTVPSRLPEDFDEDYREPTHPPRNPHAERPDPSPEERERVTAAMERLQRGIGRATEMRRQRRDAAE
jgi:hypothetical protein